MQTSRFCLSVLTRSKRYLWHGAQRTGKIAINEYCQAWTSSSKAELGASSSFTQGQLLDQSSHTCDSYLAVLCIEIHTSAVDYWWDDHNSEIELYTICGFKIAANVLLWVLWWDSTERAFSMALRDSRIRARTSGYIPLHILHYMLCICAHFDTYKPAAAIALEWQSHSTYCFCYPLQNPLLKD